MAANWSCGSGSHSALKNLRHPPMRAPQPRQPEGCVLKAPLPCGQPIPIHVWVRVPGHQDPKSCSWLLSRPGAAAKGFARGSAEGGGSAGRPPVFGPGGADVHRQG